jgi:hypothetical protein
VLLNAQKEQHMAQNIKHDADESLADDLLRGADAIAAFLGLGRRQAFHFLQKGSIPAVKEGNVWVGSKSRLRKHYTEGRYLPPPKRDLSTSAEA